MRIFNIRFSNLNSLVGEWSINLSDPAYINNGIFAITGPTGSGKSTILDAVCLALYGETPRLGKITKSTNEIMARQTGACFSEVEFETAIGRFRCHFSQRRAHGKASGELQHQKHEIVDVRTGEPIKTKLREVLAKVVEVTGMDFDRFTRSILLAQGGFAKFLLAKASDRAPILEKITGTEVYSRISIKVHEQTSEERQKLECLQGELGALQLLSIEEKINAEDELQGRVKEGDTLQEEIKILRNFQTWLEDIEKISQEIAILEGAINDFAQRKKESGPLLLKLFKAEKANGLDAEYVIIRQMRDLQKSENDYLEIKQEKLKALAENIKKAARDLQRQEGEVSKAVGAKEREAGVIIVVRALDTKIEESRKIVECLMIELREAEKKRDQISSDLKDIAADLSVKEKELRGIDSYFVNNKGDEALVENLEGIRHQLHDVVEIDKKKAKTVGSLLRVIQSGKVLPEKLKRKESEYERDKATVDALKKCLEKITSNIHELLGERHIADLRQEIEALAHRQRGLQALRAALERVDSFSLEISTLQNEFVDLENRGEYLKTKEQAFNARQKSTQEIIRHLIEKRDLFNQVLSLEDQRRRLAEDSPCPLCGALSHPYAKGNIPQYDGIRQELSKAESLLAEVLSGLSDCRVKQAEIGKDLAQARQSMQNKRLLIEQEEEMIAPFLKELKLNIRGDNGAACVGGELLKTEERLLCGKATLAKVEKELQEEQSVQEKLSASMDKLVDSKTAWEAGKNDLETQEKEQKRLADESESLSRELKGALAVVAQILNPLGFGCFLPENAAKVAVDLTRRREFWKKNQRQKERIDRELVDRINDKKTLLILLEKINNELVYQRSKLKSTALALHAKSSERRKLYGQKDPDYQEKQRQQGLLRVEKARDEARELLGTFDKEQHGIEVETDALSTSTAKRRTELAKLEKKWCESLQCSGFSDETVFLETRLDTEELDRLVALRAGIQREEIELQSQKADRIKRLRYEQEKQLTDRSREDLQQEKEGKEEDEKTLQRIIGGIRLRLDQDKKNREKQYEKIRDMEAQKKEYGRWERLHTLIGSNDGKKFRMFAQGLTFEMMIAHANRKLREMSDRYILTRNDEQPLELGVIDNYQAGEIRSTKNLSGGESFIVSLALALGLSSMASRNVRVDSLFLDEGFGTLDEEALETALETLSGLHQDGKLIGVISHVSALKERIATQIQVTPGTGGRSRLIGPGCVAHHENECPD